MWHNRVAYDKVPLDNEAVAPVFRDMISSTKLIVVDYYVVVGNNKL